MPNVSFKKSPMKWRIKNVCGKTFLQNAGKRSMKNIWLVFFIFFIRESSFCAESSLSWMNEYHSLGIECKLHWLAMATGVWDEAIYIAIYTCRVRDRKALQSVGGACWFPNFLISVLQIGISGMTVFWTLWNEIMKQAATVCWCDNSMYYTYNYWPIPSYIGDESQK